MGIPEDEQGQRWLRDYGSLSDAGGRHSTGAGGGAGIQADLPTMKEVAAALRTNVDADYVPHAQKVFDDMTAPTGPTNEGFRELYSALVTNQRTSQTTADNLANHGNGASVFADAAAQISKAYQQTDAHAAARLLGTAPTSPAADAAGAA